MVAEREVVDKSIYCVSFGWGLRNPFEMIERMLSSPRLHITMCEQQVYLWTKPDVRQKATTFYLLFSTLFGVYRIKITAVKN